MSDPVQNALEELLKSLQRHYPDEDPKVVRAALAELDQRCATARPPIDRGHALDAARQLAEMRLDPPAVAAALVAPLVVRLDVPLEPIGERLGAEVRELCEGVRRLWAIRWDRIEEEAAETLRKMFLAMAQDVRVVLIVLALRVQELREVRDAARDGAVGRGIEPVEAQRIAQETLDVFAPLANRLGIWQLKWELEDWSLRVLEPETFAELMQLLAQRREAREAFISDVTEMLAIKLREEGIEAQVKGRPKHIYSIYKKMQRKEVSFDQIYDVSAVRVTVKGVPECYAALGIVHSLWTPLPGEFDDYIARPKENGYQSLHTAVVGPQGRPVEVQIRTHEMHEYAEHGIAAHWAYKERKRSGAHDKFMVLRRLMDWERDLADPHDFVDSLKTDVFADQVYVFTPGGDIVDLPVGATPLDFAYRIHTMVGHRCRGARVNDQIVPLDYQLKTGERIEILTHKKPQPSRDWMNPALGFLKTSSGRHKVRHWFRQQGRQTAIAEGKDLVERELARLELAYATLADVAELLKYPTIEDLYAAVGYGDRHSESIASAALHIEREKAPPEEPELPPSIPLSKKKRAASGLRLDGVDEILGKRARCCNPVPGDDVVGFVTRGRGIMIHRRDCTNIADTPEPERLVEIAWGPDASERHPVDVEIRANDRPGLLRDMSNLISSAGVNITSARAEGNKGGTGWLRLSLEFESAEQVVKVLQKIAHHPDVLEVRRVAR